jgi:hypothetical protein
MRRLAKIAAIAFTLLCFSSTVLAAGKAVQRPFEDFLNAQGQFCIDDGSGGCFLFVPPDPNFLGWNNDLDKSTIYFAGVDYAGLANAYDDGIVPQVSGTVMERPLNDGTAEVTVNLHVKGANVWVIKLDLEGDLLDQIANKPTVFGHRPRDVIEPLDAEPALGDAHFRIVFINSVMGAPLPDLIEFNLGRSGLKTIMFSMSAFGPLTAEFGVVEGTPGRCTIVQTGLLSTHGQGAALADLFPAESINLQVVGR